MALANTASTGHTTKLHPKRTLKRTAHPAMTKLLTDYPAMDTLSAHWNRAAAQHPEPPHRPLAQKTTRPPTPVQLSAPDFNPRHTDVLSSPTSTALSAGARIFKRIKNAAPFLWQPNSAGTRALRAAARSPDAPAPMQQAAQDAAEVTALGRDWLHTVHDDALHTVHHHAHALKEDPLKSLRELAHSHAQAWHDTGYALAQTVYETPSSLLNPFTIAGLALAGTLKTVKPNLRLVASQDRPDYRVPQPPTIAYRSAPPDSSHANVRIDTARGPIRVATKQGDRSDFNVRAVKDNPYNDGDYVQGTLHGRNLGPGRIEITTYDTPSWNSLDERAQAIATGLLWAGTGPGHGLPTRQINLPINKRDLNQLRTLDPLALKELPIALELAAALNLLGIDWVHAQIGTHRGREQLIVHTQARQNHPSEHAPRLDPKIPQAFKVQRIGTLLSKQNTNGTQGLFGSAGSIIPTQSLNAFDAATLQSARARLRTQGFDPLNPVTLIDARSQIGNKRFFLVDQGNLQLWAAHLEGSDTVIAKHFGTRRERKDESLLKAAESFSGISFKR